MNTAATTATPTAADQPPGPQLWVIAELMGHKRIAGVLTRDTSTGLTLARIDVPAVTYVDGQVWRNGALVDRVRTIPAHSSSLADGAVYTIHWVDEAVSRIAAATIRHCPARLFDLWAEYEILPADERDSLAALVKASALLQCTTEDDDAHPN